MSDIIKQINDDLAAVDAKWTHITKTATSEDEFRTYRDRIHFHAFNPNGLCQRKLTNDQRISQLVDEGKAKSGAILAYGTFDSYSYDRVMKLANRRWISGTEYRVSIEMLRFSIDSQEKAITRFESQS